MPYKSRMKYLFWSDYKIAQHSLGLLIYWDILEKFFAIKELNQIYIWSDYKIAQHGLRLLIYRDILEEFLATKEFNQIYILD